MKKYFFIGGFFYFLATFHLVAQVLPPVENYPVEVYQAGNQNWDISQAKNKYIYIGNNSGLLEFDGSSWNLYTSLNGSSIRSVKVVDDFIYTGGYLDFGFWLKDEFGDLQYTSLIKKLAEPLVEDEEFWNILKVDDWVLFQSLDRIYSYNTKEGTFNVIEAKTKRAAIFKVGDVVYFQKTNEGIYKIENGSPILVSDSQIFQQNVLVGAFLTKGKTLLLTEEGEFYILEKENLIKWNIEANKELEAKGIYSSKQLSDGSFALGSISNGIYHLDENGNILKNINKEKGLINNTVLSIYEDHDRNLWLGLDNGISVLNLNSPFSVYRDLKGHLGVVYAAETIDNYLYLGTNQGLFYRDQTSNNEFKLIENTVGQVWCLKEIQSTLFCGHNNGTYIIDKESAKLISNFPGTWDVKEIATDENLLLQGNFSGVSILQKVDDQWEFRNSFDEFTISSRFIEFVNDKE